MPNAIVKSLQELAKKPKYEYEVRNKIFKSMQDADEVVLKEVVTFFLGLELENLQELKDRCNQLQAIQNEKPNDKRYSDFGTGYIQEEGNENGTSFLLKKDIREILSKKIIPIVEKPLRILTICEKLEDLAMKHEAEEDIYRYLNGEVFTCRNSDVFTIDDMRFIAEESYKTLLPHSNPSTVEFLHKAAKMIEDGEWGEEEKRIRLIQDFINNTVHPKCDGTISKPYVSLVKKRILF